MKPHIMRLPPTGDAEKFRVMDASGERVVIISGCLMSVTNKPPLQLLIEQLKDEHHHA